MARMMAKKAEKKSPKRLKDLPAKVLTSKQVKDVKGGACDGSGKDPYFLTR